MNLRTRLFFWVSTLFVVVAAVSYVIENRVTAKQLERAKQDVAQEILEQSEKRRKGVQEFITELIAESIVRIDAVLHNILQFTPDAMRFSPIRLNEEQGTWGEAADLLIEYKWLDFLQNTANGKVTAMIAPGEDATRQTYQLQIEKGIYWAFVKGDPKVYLGVELPYFLTGHLKEEKPQHISGKEPLLLFLFDPQEMKALDRKVLSEKKWEPVSVKWIEGYSLDMEAFVKNLLRGSMLVTQTTLKPPSLSESQVVEKIEQVDSPLPVLFSSRFLSSLPQEKLMKRRLEEVAHEYTQVNLIWLWMAVFNQGVFGDNLFAKTAPVAVNLVGDQNLVGLGIESKGTLFAKGVFDDAAYYEGSQKVSGLAAEFAVISSKNHLFLGNTAQLAIDSNGEKSTGYLTLGVDTDMFLERLVLATGQTAFVLHGGTVFGGYAEDGSILKEEERASLPLEDFKKNALGEISWRDNHYFYMRLDPFENEDLHLVLLNPVEKQFALLDDLEKGVGSVADAILFNIHLMGLIVLLVALCFLHRIARKVTKPIAELAGAISHVSEGHLERVELKQRTFKHHDEIEQLYKAFQEMVQGLKEKEKVQGVLNKVVSAEIAQEILKGSVHLGGEKKKVSVLFADIRGFTHMTQYLDAQAVIALLNDCMTRLSHIVDTNQGVIDKYVGDEVMALFGAPMSQKEDALHAVKSAWEMIGVLKEWNEERKARAEESIEVGVGIHTGEVSAGNMGAENRLNYTVIGSNVNLAARLCSEARPMEILISEQTLSEVKERISYEALDPMELKGFDEKLIAYRVTGLLL